MMQQWADLLDSWQSGGKAVSESRKKKLLEIVAPVEPLLEKPKSGEPDQLLDNEQYADLDRIRKMQR